MRDVRYSKQSHENWKEAVARNSIDNISEKSSDLIIEYIRDLEAGINLGKAKKGARSYSRMIVSRTDLIKLAKWFEGQGVEDLSKVTKPLLHKIFKELREGKITMNNGQKYSDTTISTLATIFCAYWNWYRRKYNQNDICEDLDKSGNETKFVYITKQQMEKLLPYLNYQEQLITSFIFDSLARPPKEVLSLKGKDFEEREGQVWITIPDSDEEGRIAKTFGRTFNLLFSGDEIIKHIKKNKIKENDYVFDLDYKEYCKKLKVVAKQILGNNISHSKAKKRYNELEPYDLRHAGCIHLRILASKNNAISLDAIRQRAGWKDFEMLNWYSQMIGITGEIKKESLMIQEDKTKLEKEFETMKKENREIKKILKEIQIMINREKTNSVMTK